MTRLLDQAYEDLDLINGSLVRTASEPTGDIGALTWSSVGDWLTLANRAGAERVYFVDNEPVLLFATLPSGSTEADIVRAYRKAWCLSRPQCLFLATEEELRVYALSTSPVRSTEELHSLNPIAIVARVADVAETLAEFHRERLETGTSFNDIRRRNEDGWADQQLLQDVRAATEALHAQGLSRSLAHELIERVILVRYLEDRGVINETYFEEVAGADNTMQEVLATDPETVEFGPVSIFARCLSSKRLTYQIFNRLASDFNGDLFVSTPDEEREVQREHLLLIQRLLTGAGLGPQESLYLWAYDFSMVPTNLISSMYEHFYRAGTDDDTGTHYTPPELVEYVLSQVLKPEILADNPRVVDPTCGSGIFIVEAFRLIVRHEMARRGAILAPHELREILLTRIAGIDINGEAVKLAAFSLYLAYLSYQTPQDIRLAGPLPRLIYRQGGQGVEPRVLVQADAFLSFSSESGSQRTPRTDTLPWPEGAFDVVIGNPPWDEPRSAARRLGDNWARQNQLPVGDRNTSQLFLWRALSFVSERGTSALLVSATAFHNSRSTSREFRARWLAEVTLEQVINFTPAREVFFGGATAPFMLVQFRPVKSAGSQTFTLYRTVRPSEAFGHTRSMAYAYLDRKWVEQKSLRQRDYLWKTYAWGSHHDDALLARLDTEVKLRELLPNDLPHGYGYQYGPREPSDLLAMLPSLRTFTPWGPLDPGWFEEPPSGVKRQPDERLYRGQRIVIKRGVLAGFGPAARLEDRDFSFRHVIYSLPLQEIPQWQAKTLLAIILSSLGRYRFFMASGSWGVWYDSIVPDDILDLPVRFAGAGSNLTRAILSAVDRLQESGPPQDLVSGQATQTDIFGGVPADPALRDLDALIYELFDLSKSERDLIEDFRRYTLDYSRRKSRSRALSKVQLPSDTRGIEMDLAQISAPQLPVVEYLATFLRTWNREFSPDGELEWRLIRARRAPILAAVFETRYRSETGYESSPEGDSDQWQNILERLASSLNRPLFGAVTIDGVVRAVSDTSIVVIKRDETRLWTANTAREDVEATLLQAMNLQES
jgi:hypothetical protein